MAGIAGINHIPKGRETQPASRPVGRATPEEPQESLHLRLTHTVLPLCAWTYLAIGAGLLEHPVEETQTDRLGMPWMRLDAAQPTPGAGRDGAAIHLLEARTERASLQAWSISKSYARACTGCPGLGEFSVLQIQSQTCPGDVMLLRSVCDHGGGVALAVCVLRASEKAPTCKRKEKMLCWLHDGLLHLSTVSSSTSLWGQRVGGARGAHFLPLLLSCSALLPSN